MVADVQVSRRWIAEIRYEIDPESWEGAADHFGRLLVADRQTIHDQLRGVSVAVLVDVPSSYVDRGWRRHVLYASPADVMREYGRDDAETRARARLLLEAEAREYRAWYDGEVFGFIVREETRCEACDCWSVVAEDSCWGFIASGSKSDLLDWMGAQLEGPAREALADAFEHWTGYYPVAARGVWVEPAA